MGDLCPDCGTASMGGNPCGCKERAARRREESIGLLGELLGRQVTVAAITRLPNATAVDLDVGEESYRITLTGYILERTR